MKTDVIIVGGFHEIIEICEECGLNVVGIIDNELKDAYFGVPILGKDEDAERLFPRYGGCKVIITPDSPKVREKLVNLYNSIGYDFATLISPLAHISKSVGHHYPDSAGNHHWLWGVECGMVELLSGQMVVAHLRTAAVVACAHRRTRAHGCTSELCDSA